MAPARLPLLLALSLSSLSACRPEPTPTPTSPPAEAEAPTPAAFLARVDAELRDRWIETTAAQWLSANTASPEAERLATLAEHRDRRLHAAWRRQAARWSGHGVADPLQRRQLERLQRPPLLPLPADPGQSARLLALTAQLEGGYVAAAACQGRAPSCRPLSKLEQVLAGERDYPAQLQAWREWLTAVAPLHAPFRAAVELANAGARRHGQPDLGALWRSRYEQPPAKLQARVEALWRQLAPLYRQLQCYAGHRLRAEYGDRGTLEGGLLPAHLLGDPWQQDWTNVWDLLVPYPQAASPDVTDALQRRADRLRRTALAQAGNGSLQARFLAARAGERAAARALVADAEGFYTGLGLPPLPERFWQYSRFLRPLEAPASCAASTWNLDLAGDVRVQLCLGQTEGDFLTAAHELGHAHYERAYRDLPAWLQDGANDAFHEAVGDIAMLAMTPRWLHSAGLAAAPGHDHHARINAQMRIALARLPRLAAALALEHWRWGVFAGRIPAAQDNRAWWTLKARYQGVGPAEPRPADGFDVGAKYHVAAYRPYLRYFLAGVLQFQFHQALCAAAGQHGPLSDCEIAGDRRAGQHLQAMLASGARQPWPQTLQAFTGHDDFDAGPLLDYFAPLAQWLAEQNRGQDCLWTPEGLAADGS